MIDPVTLQVMLGALRSACDEMGAVLVRSAHSANIKERRDSSTALFDADGQMVMQAEHIPVHLGAMPTAVAAVLDEDHRPGDVWILNDPYRGGTHLPDITVISPVFAGRTDRFRRKPRAPRRRRRTHAGKHAGRLAHARGGGRGDPAVATRRRSPAELTAQMRSPDQRRADLRAQLAANRTGAARLEALAERHGLELLRDAMAATLDYSERRTRARIAELEDGERTAPRRPRGRRRRHRAAAAGNRPGDEMELDFTGPPASTTAISTARSP